MFILKRLAILAGDGSTTYTTNDVLSSIDFWMSDRASDCDVLLDELGVDPDQRLKCSAHVLLTTPEAIESLLKQVRRLVA